MMMTMTIMMLSISVNKHSSVEHVMGISSPGTVGDWRTPFLPRTGLWGTTTLSPEDCHGPQRPPPPLPQQTVRNWNNIVFPNDSDCRTQCRWLYKPFFPRTDNQGLEHHHHKGLQGTIGNFRAVLPFELFYCWFFRIFFIYLFIIRSNLVFYAQSTITVISMRFFKNQKARIKFFKIKLKKSFIEIKNLKSQYNVQ